MVLPYTKVPLGMHCVLGMVGNHLCYHQVVFVESDLLLSMLWDVHVHGGYPSIRHNELRDITAELLTEVCHSVGIEPTLQPLTGEQFSYRSANVEDGARLDVVAEGFWDHR